MTALTGDFDIDATTSGLPAGSGSDGGQTEAIVQNARDAEDLRLYLRHVEGGETIRSLAREIGCHASTVLRRIRRIEARRDDPLIDQALGRAGQANAPGGSGGGETAQFRRILRRLAERDAQLVLVAGMEKAIVVRNDVRIAILDRRIAERIALNGWVRLSFSGKVMRYVLSTAGREALKRMVEARRGGLPGAGEFAQADPVPGADMAEAAAGFDHPGRHRVWAARDIDDPEDGSRRRMRVNVAESPCRCSPGGAMPRVGLS